MTKVVTIVKFDLCLDLINVLKFWSLVLAKRIGRHYRRFCCEKMKMLKMWESCQGGDLWMDGGSRFPFPTLKGVGKVRSLAPFPISHIERLGRGGNSCIIIEIPSLRFRDCYPFLWVNTFDSPTGIGIKECGAWRLFTRKRREVEKVSETGHR